mgnify:CR=1 FL=1
MKKANIIIWLIASLMTGLAIGTTVLSKNAYFQGIERSKNCINNGGVILIIKNQDYCIYD